MMKSQNLRKTCTSTDSNTALCRLSSECQDTEDDIFAPRSSWTSLLPTVLFLEDYSTESLYQASLGAQYESNGREESLGLAIY